MKLALTIFAALAAAASAEVTISQSGTGYNWKMKSKSELVGVSKAGNWPVLTVPVNTPITFEGKTGFSHYFAIGKKLSKKEGDALVWMKEQKGKAFSVTYTFSETGEFKYYCPPHMTIMKGKIQVVDLESPETTEGGEEEEKPAVVPCAEREKCTGKDEVGKCYFNKYTKACQSGKPTKPETCGEIVNPMACKMGCKWDKETTTCLTITKKPTAAPVPCAERTKCIGSDEDGRCYFNKYTKACQSGKVSKPETCGDIVNPMACKMGCKWDKETTTCLTITKKPTAAPAPCAERTKCIGSDEDGKCYFNKYTKACQSGKPSKPETCGEIVNPMACKMGCFWNKYTETCGDDKPTKPETCGEIVNPMGCKQGCFWNKYTETCGDEKPTKPETCDAITNAKMCKFNCVWDKVDGACAQKTSQPTAPIVPCEERTKCIGKDAVGKCAKNYFTGGCSSKQRGEKPETCEEVSSEKYCAKMGSGCVFEDGECKTFGAGCSLKGFKPNCEKLDECTWTCGNTKSAKKGKQCCAPNVE